VEWQGGEIPSYQNVAASESSQHGATDSNGERDKEYQYWELNGKRA